VSKYVRTVGVVCILSAAFCCDALVPRAFGLAESTQSGGSNTVAVHQLGETGEGVNIGLILARNVRATHEAFTDSNGLPHAFNYDFSGDGNAISSHDTQLAGIISSRGGASYPDDIGVAPGADIYCARVADNDDEIDPSWLDGALKELVLTHNCRVVVTGFELTGLTPDGDNPWTMLYDYYAYEHNVVFANAAGNRNTYVSVFGDAYNGITTGGLRLNDPNNQYEYRRVGLVSGTGPTTDGRRKPDLTAPAQNQTVPTSSSDTAWTTVGTTSGQTSYSVPHTAGAAALLLGLADETAEPNDNQSEVIKAALVNSTMPNIDDKDGVQTNPADSNNTWQADRGYGRLDVLKAYLLLDSNEIEPDVNVTANSGWGFGRISPGQMEVYTISVTERCRLIATLTWQRRVRWIDNNPHNGLIEPSELTAYLADLDMLVYAPNDVNAVFSEDAFGLSTSDNLEKCDIRLDAAGEYTIIIENNSTNGETADYGFAFELHPVLTGDLPPYDYSVDYGDIATLSDDWLAGDSPLDELLILNGVVDFGDFAEMAPSWLQSDPYYHQEP